MMLEAKSFTFDLAFDGIPAKLGVRVFVHKGKVVGVRTLRLLEPEYPNAPIRTFNDGKVELEDVEMGADR